MKRILIVGLLVLFISGIGLAVENDRGDIAIGWNLSMIRGFSGMTGRIALSEAVEIQPIVYVEGSSYSLNWNLALRGLYSLGQRGSVYRYAFGGAAVFPTHYYDGPSSLDYGIQGGIGLEWRWFSSPLHNTVEFLMGYNSSSSGYSGVGLATGLYYYF